MSKIICISDSHGKHRSVKMPEGDILVHAGDISAGRGNMDQLIDFNKWLGELDYDHIICIPGNHDFVFRDKHKLAMDTMTNCRVLMDQEHTASGIKFYGSPFTPWFGGWAFNLPRGIALKEKWAMIPGDTDVLITHGPPYGILDVSGISYENCGCYDLLDRINVVKPKISCFGHIHHGYGIEKQGNTTFVNASICNEAYAPNNKPIIMEV